MKGKVFRQTVFISAVVCTASTAWASDVGLPLYADDNNASRANIEVYYSDISRDARQLYDIGGETGVEQEEERIIVRLNYALTSRAALYAEIGATNSYTSDGNEPLFGAGLRVKIYDGDFFVLTGVASGTYIPKIEYHDEWQEDDGRHVKWFQEESYSELSGGLIISQEIALSGDIIWTPYGGFMGSKIYGDEDYTLFYYQEEKVKEADGYLEEDSPFFLFAGLRLALNNTWGIRLEGRFINRTSFSGGLTYSF